MNKTNMRLGMVCLSILIFLTANMQLLSSSQTSNKSLKEIYQGGKIEFAPELTITRDSFPDDVHVKVLVGFTLWENSLYILDASLCDLKVLTTDGRFKKRFGQKGKGAGDLYLPYYAAFSADNLIVWESGNRRFSVFNPEGKFVKHVRLKHKGRVKDIKTVDDGRFVLEWELAGKVKNEVFQFCVLELYSKDFEFIKMLYKKQVIRGKYIPKPKPRYLLQPYQPDVSWDVLPGNKIVIGYSGQYRLEILELTSGKTHVFSHTNKPIKITETDKNAFFDSMVRGGPNGRPRKGADKFTRENTTFPDYKPAFKKILTDYEGNILVFNYEKNGRGNSRFRAKSFDAFDSRGNYINRVEIGLEDGIYILKIASGKENVFWTIVETDYLDSGIIKYRAR